MAQVIEYDLQDEIRDCPRIMEKIRSREDYAQNLYAAWCNMQWCKRELWPVLSERYWSASWRGAGGIVATLRGRGEDYMDYYCSGMGGFATYDEQEGEEYMASKKYVPEGHVTEEIAKDLYDLGWIPVPYNDDMV
jgi:hypothetical protein